MLTKVIWQIKNNKFEIAAVAILSLFLAPYLILGEDVHIRIIDEMDGAISLLKLYGENGFIFSKSNTLEQVMNGLPFEKIYPWLNVTLLLFAILSPFAAYAVNNALVHLIALVGMYLLLSRHFIKDKSEGGKLIIAGSSLCFALLPFYSIFGLSVSGLPLLFYAFINIKNQSGKLTDYLLILLYSLYSFFLFSGLYILPLLGIWFVYDWISNRKLNNAFGAAILLFIFANTASYHTVISSLIFPSDFVSFRVEMGLFTDLSLEQAINKGLQLFIYNGHFHSPSLHIFILWIVIPLALLIGIIRKEKTKIASIAGILFFICIFSLWHGLWEWKSAMLPIKNQFKVLHYFDATRLHATFPMLWLIVMALGLAIIIKIRQGRILVAIFILLQVAYSFGNNIEHSRWIDRAIGKELNNKLLRLLHTRTFYDRLPAASISYREFFSTELFEEIKQYINRPQKDYRVASIGLHPSVSHYNGFYTLDGYSSNYALSHKHQFRRIIARELEKMPERKRNIFDAWGGRCYLLVDEIFSKLRWDDYWTLTKYYADRKKVKIKNLDLNIDAFREMGGEYFFSTVEIVNSRENHLYLLNVFENEKSPWRIFLYGVNPAEES